MTEEVQAQSTDDTNPQGDAESLNERIATLEREVEEHKTNWMRAIADFKNYKRRTESEREELIRNASAGLMLKLLPVLDDLLLAMGQIPAEIENNQWIGGVKQVQRKFETVLEGAGLQPIPAVDEEFDPNIHEAIMFEEGDEAQSNKVVAELRRGYKLGERVLSPTVVKVGK